MRGRYAIERVSRKDRICDFLKDLGRAALIVSIGAVAVLTVTNVAQSKVLAEYDQYTQTQSQQVQQRDQRIQELEAQNQQLQKEKDNQVAQKDAEIQRLQIENHDISIAGPKDQWRYLIHAGQSGDKLAEEVFDTTAPIICIDDEVLRRNTGEQKGDTFSYNPGVFAGGSGNIFISMPHCQAEFSSDIITAQSGAHLILHETAHKKQADGDLATEINGEKVGEALADCYAIQNTAGTLRGLGFEDEKQIEAAVLAEAYWRYSGETNKSNVVYRSSECRPGGEMDLQVADSYFVDPMGISLEGLWLTFQNAGLSFEDLGRATS